MRARPLVLPAATAMLAVAIGGCGVSDPYQHPAHPGLTVTSSTSVTTSLSSAAAARGGSGSALGVLRRYATLSIDWTSRTLADRQRELEWLAVAGARAQAVQTAATYGAGSSLRRSRVANRGQITSIAPGQGPRRGWWVITTQETTTGTGDYQGLPARAHVYDARLIRTRRGWRVETWAPQN